jgi:hypothetical protein
LLSTNNFCCTIETCPALIEFEICQGNKKKDHTTGKDILFRGVVYFIPVKCGMPPYNCFRRLGDARSSNECPHMPNLVIYVMFGEVVVSGQEFFDQTFRDALSTTYRFDFE